MKNTNANNDKLDGIDKMILQILMDNARCSIQDISKQISLTPAAVHKRIKKLREQEIINGSKLLINYKMMGYNTLAFVGIYLSEAVTNYQAVQRLSKIPEVLECHYTTGNWSILIKILCKDNEHLMQLLYTKIQTIEGVSRTETFVSLSQQINRELKP